MARLRSGGVKVRVVGEKSAAQPGFLTLHRYEIVAEQEGKISRPVDYDLVVRKHMDAAVVAAHYAADGREHVILRSCVRPPVALRAGDANLWELPAGLIEDGEDPRRAAARELWEEIGARVDPRALEDLGPPTLPAAGIIAEKNHFFHVVVDPASLVTPAGDDSPLEEGGAIVHLPLEEALELVGGGALPDAKTEIGLRRLFDLVRTKPA